MTSSLVGSEMCIRDRISESRRFLEAVQMQGLAAWHINGDTPDAERQWAVSYTHLTLPTICSV
eukprot:12216-Prorocentrum_lima.AAC.1